MSATDSSTILIAGGSGLIGSRLCRMLADKGYKVCILTRNKESKSRYPTFLWNPSKNEVDPAALQNATAVINLAGSGIADHRWTNSYKKEIIQSRLDATATLLNEIKNHPGVKSYIAASAIGIYGNRGKEILDENSLPGTGFLSSTTKQWESSSENCTVRRVLIRTGIVLTPKGGALPPLARPVKAMIAPVIGGDQYMSWIHVDDLCRIFISALENESWNGIYNAVVPNAVTHREFVTTLKKVLNPNAIIIPVPPALVKILLGEQSVIILDSANVKPSRAIATGFQFMFEDLTNALENLYAH
jgi:uncharacterized protein (TIGR01777 family)